MEGNEIHGRPVLVRRVDSLSARFGFEEGNGDCLFVEDLQSSTVSRFEGYRRLQYLLTPFTEELLHAVGSQSRPVLKEIHYNPCLGDEAFATLPPGDSSA